MPMWLAATASCALVTSSMSATTVSAKAMELRDRGFTVLEDVVCPEALLSRAAETSGEMLNVRLEDIANLGCDPTEQGYAFHDICHRSRLRWDLEAPDEHGYTRAVGTRAHEEC